MRATMLCRAILIGTAGAILALSSATAAPQAGKLEATYVVLGGDGAIARAILSGGGECPAITIGTGRRSDTPPMRVRARPDQSFGVLVCEAALPAGATSATIARRRLPLPKAQLDTIAVFGDTGCRLKASKSTNDVDEPPHGQFQACDRHSKWPFAGLATTVAARRPDLVVHVGDYVYRESPCPAGDAGCKGSPYGDQWPTWKADFFTPAARLLAVAPWIVARGNHEICERAGAGFFRFLDPRLAQNEAPPACIERTPIYTVTLPGKAFVVMDSSDACDGDNCDTAVYAAQFASLKPAPGSWFVTHRPVWGIGKDFTISPTLQKALAVSDGKLPDGITLALAGHMHVFQTLSFTDKRSPIFVIGTGGTALDAKFSRPLAGMTVGGATVSYGRIEHEFGFALMKPERAGAGGDWRLTFVTAKGRAKFSCRVTTGEARCR
jgi:hypothetical protein